MLHFCYRVNETRKSIVCFDCLRLLNIKNICFSDKFKEIPVEKSFLTANEQALFSLCIADLLPSEKRSFSFEFGLENAIYHSNHN